MAPDCYSKSCCYVLPQERSWLLLCFSCMKNLCDVKVLFYKVLSKIKLRTLYRIEIFFCTLFASRKKLSKLSGYPLKYGWICSYICPKRHKNWAETIVNRWCQSHTKNNKRYDIEKVTVIPQLTKPQLVVRSLVSIPGHTERRPGIHCLCMRQSPRILSFCFFAFQCSLESRLLANRLGARTCASWFIPCMQIIARACEW